ncbi:hypothetical protein Aduo_005745 [Ancylostoma duodenale]
MTKKKVRSSRAASSQKAARRSRSRSPLPDDVDVFAPLSSMMSDHEKLASTAVTFVGWSDVVRMLPPYLQKHILVVICISSTVKIRTMRAFGRSRDDVILLVSDELDGMSKKRILRVLQGEDALSSSSSSEVSEEDEDAGSERLPNQSSESDERSAEASAHSDSESSSTSERSEVDGSESERASFSDIELIEGLDVDSNNLPDVSGT